MAPWTALLKEIIWCRSYIPIEEADSYTNIIYMVSFYSS
jgi:hypothetical protein